MEISCSVYNGFEDTYGKDIYKYVMSTGLTKLYNDTTTCASVDKYSASHCDTLKDFARREVVYRNNLPDCLSFNDWWSLFEKEVDDKYGEKFRLLKNELTSEE